eukprot:506859-Amphidinium_carterae.1
MEQYQRMKTHLKDIERTLSLYFSCRLKRPDVGNLTPLRNTFPPMIPLQLFFGDYSESTPASVSQHIYQGSVDPVHLGVGKHQPENACSPPPYVCTHRSRRQQPQPVYRPANTVSVRMAIEPVQT